MLEINIKAKPVQVLPKETPKNGSDDAYWIPLTHIIMHKGVPMPDAITIAKRCDPTALSLKMAEKISIMNILSTGFSWLHQPEGSDFWMYVWIRADKGQFKNLFG